MTLEYEIRKVWVADGGRVPHAAYRVYDVTNGRLAKVAEFGDYRSAVDWILGRAE